MCIILLYSLSIIVLLTTKGDCEVSKVRGSDDCEIMVEKACFISSLITDQRKLSLESRLFPHTVPDTINRLGFYNKIPGSDYPPPLQGRIGQLHQSPITDTTRVVCYTQSIYEDEAVEQDEFFSLILSIQSTSAEMTAIDPNFRRALFKIVDNDDSDSALPGMISASVLHVLYTL